MIPRWRPTWREAPVLAVVLHAILLALFLTNTRPLEANAGFGYDGEHYAALVRWLRGDTGEALMSPFAYRVLPPALVAASGLEIRLGFLALNVGALIASGLVLLSILRTEGATPVRALVLVGWFALLPNGLRYAVAYPVLVDGVGTLAFVALLAAAQRRNAVLFAALLVPGVLTREHLILLAPLAATIGGRRGIAQVAAVALPAALALVVVHAAASDAVSGPSTLRIALFNGLTILTNAEGAAFRLLAAPLLTLGAFVAAALARRDALIATLQTPRWGYAAAVIVATGAIGGLDHDRYFVWLAPLLAIAAARMTWTPIAATVLTMLHVVVARALIPLDGSANGYLHFVVKQMPLDQLAVWTLVATAATVIGALIASAGDGPGVVRSRLGRPAV